MQNLEIINNDQAMFQTKARYQEPQVLGIYNISTTPAVVCFSHFQPVKLSYTLYILLIHPGDRRGIPKVPSRH